MWVISMTSVATLDQLVKKICHLQKNRKEIVNSTADLRFSDLGKLYWKSFVNNLKSILLLFLTLSLSVQLPIHQGQKTLQKLSTAKRQDCKSSCSSSLKEKTLVTLKAVAYYFPFTS